MLRVPAQNQLTSLLAQIRACRKCIRAGYPIAPVPIVCGQPGARVMTVGQAPGPTEVVAKRPFNAGSGKRLFQWLAEAGFEEVEFRSAQHMTAVTKCYPGRSDAGHGDRVPSPEEQALCRPWLDRELALVNPQLIIPIGRLAIGLFFDLKLPLDRIIGTQLTQDGRVIVPLPHPSGASTWHQKPANRALVSQAIGLIRRQREALGL
jgi:uracil-DNA glycosylase family 4